MTRILILFAFVFASSLYANTIPVSLLPTVIPALPTVTVLESPITTSETWVDGTYTIETEGWGIDHFSSLQEAINNTSPQGAVYVRPGTYNETVIIYKDINIIPVGDASISAKDAGTKGLVIANLIIDNENGFKTRGPVKVTGQIILSKGSIHTMQ